MVEHGEKDVKKGTSCEVLTPNFLGTTSFVGGFLRCFRRMGLYSRGIASFVWQVDAPNR